MNENQKIKEERRLRAINMDNILNAEIINDPWPHAIIDGILDIGNLYTKKNKEPIPSTLVWLNNVHDIFYENIENILNKYRSDRVGYEEKLKDKYYIDWSLQFQPPGGKFGKHTEDGRKLWSMAIYISPDNSTGTLIYDKHQNFVKEVEWKINRAIVFCGTGESVHAYENRTDTVRLTLNVFICMDRPKKGSGK
jgi:hypothetical protein